MVHYRQTWTTIRYYLASRALQFLVQERERVLRASLKWRWLHGCRPPRYKCAVCVVAEVVIDCHVESRTRFSRIAVVTTRVSTAFA